MRHFVFAMLLLGSSAMAQDTDTQTETERGLSLMERGAQLFLEGLLDEVEPAISDLADLMQDAGPQFQEMMREMGPALAELIGTLDDITNYEAPELLPNGDIIIRRKPDAPVFEPEAGIEL